MGELAYVGIQDFSNSDSVIQPILTVSQDRKAPTLTEMMDNIEDLFKHQEFYARASHDIIAHL